NGSIHFGSSAEITPPIPSQRPNRRTGYGTTSSLESFCADPVIVSLQWLGDVVEQFLHDHGDYGRFLRDYRDAGLSKVVWSVEAIPVE
ncbi:hypothetical protein ACFY9Z_44055, partial [Streptomyces sp. NPDC010273]